MEEDVQFRRSLPQDYLNYMGVSFSDEVSVIFSDRVSNIL